MTISSRMDSRVISLDLHFTKMMSLYFALLLASYCVSMTHAESCGSIYNKNLYNDSQSYLSSPNYPSKYPSSCTCEWTISAPTGFVVELTFTSFDTEGYFSSGSCSSFSDTLSIYDGSYFSDKLIGKYCSNILPPKVYSSGTSLYLKFRSDHFTEKQGFRIKYKAVVAKPDSTICSPFNTFSQNNNIKYIGSSGYVKSPLYGTKYPSSMQCTWVITAPKDHKIKLTFSDFKLEGKRIFCSNYYSSSEDQLEIRDGKYSFSNSLKRLCGTSFPSPVYSSGRYMWIRFRSNTDNDATTSTTGFKAKFEAQSISSSSTNVTGIVVGVIIAVVFVIFLVVICVCISNRKRTPGHVNVPAPAPATQTTVHSTQNPQQIENRFVTPPVGYPAAPKGSHPPPLSGYYPPPPGSYPPLAAGAAPDKPLQSSFPMMQYPPQPIPNDPPPAYPGPPSYPPSNYQQVAPTSANQPYPPPQDTEHQQSPYPPAPGATQPTAPPSF